MLIIFPVRWLPYLLALGGVAIGVLSVPTLMTKSEAKPTAVTLQQMQSKTPDERWLRVTGGGLSMRDTLVNGTTRTNKKTNAVTTRTEAYFVPLISRMQAFERGQSRSDAFAPNTKLVLVRFESNEFLKKFPNSASYTGNRAFQEMPIEGFRTRSGVPSELHGIINNDFRLPIENVTVIDANNTPPKKSDAALTILCGFAIAASGVGWLKLRMM
jgi:hypothetical protein